LALKLFFSQFVFDESGRRILQNLVAQYASWVDQTFKFITTYGEGLVETMDYETYPLMMQGTRLSEAQRTMFKAEHAIDEEFRSIVESISNILSPLLGPGSEIDRFVEAMIKENTTSVSSPTPNVKGAAATHAAVSSPPSAVLLLGDDLLQLLPLEALSLFSTRFAGNVIRDFSVSVLGNRFKQAPEAVDKISIQSSAVVCMIDPFGDDHGNQSSVLPSQTKVGESDGRTSPKMSARSVPSNQNFQLQLSTDRVPMTQVVSALQQLTGGVSGGSKWGHVFPPERRGGGVSLQDWISASLSTNGSAYTRLLFNYSPGKVVGSHILPKDLAAVSMRGVALAIIADMTQTDGSCRRQLAMDSRKTPDDLSLENPLVTAILFSLSGAACVVTSQWSITPTALEKMTTVFWRDFSKGSGNAMQAVSRSRNFQIEVGADELPLAPTWQSEYTNPVPTPTAVSTARKAVGLRRWIKYSRVVYGIGSIQYNA
jgi:hypothetical protein